MSEASPAPDVRFWFDPVCPFAWMTSTWVRTVQAQRDYTVEWRFISLRLLNAHIDYDAHFPPEYEAGHTAGLRLLRVFAHVRDDHGPAAVEALYPAVSSRIFDVPPESYDATDLEPLLDRGAGGGRAAGHPGRAARRRHPRRAGPGRDRRGARADRQGRRYADPAHRAARRGGVLRARHQPATLRRGGRAALGPRRRARDVPRLRRAQAQPAREAAAALLRRRGR